MSAQSDTRDPRLGVTQERKRGQFGSCPKSVIADKRFSINELWVRRSTTGLP